MYMHYPSCMELIMLAMLTANWFWFRCNCRRCNTYAQTNWWYSYFDKLIILTGWGGSVAEWRRRALVCLRQTVHTQHASTHQAALLRIAGVTAGLAESNGSLPSGLWLTSPAGWLPRTDISSGTLRSVIEHGLPFLIGWTERTDRHRH